MSSDDSSSDDQNTEQLREAVWSSAPVTDPTHDTRNDGKRNVKASKRVDVREHEHDGNELQTTPEFRSHVARKLVAILDSCITVTSGIPDTKPEHNQEEEDDAGFRLFSTSLPGRCWKEPTPQVPPKRPPAPSSSDSDSEMERRLKEAAVSVSDLLPVSTEQTQEKGERADATVESTVPVKKTKRRMKASIMEREEESVSKADGAAPQDQGAEEQGLKIRKKKPLKVPR
ncbi:protein CUSTOS isoform X2 [Brachyhypopomus gauderio]